MTIKGAKGVMIAASVAGLFAMGASAAASAKETDVMCHGVNACKGQGGCKGASNACKGQNGCKGQGNVKMSKAECAKKGGTAAEAK